MNTASYSNAHEMYDNVAPCDTFEEDISDEELYELMAQVWVDYGGDVDGFTRCVEAIKKSIDTEISFRNLSKLRA